MAERLGFIGLGIMGLGMARNLMKAGHELTVWNRTTSKAEALASEGAKVADNPADLATNCDIIFVCVSDTPDVQEVLLGDSGVVHGAHSGALVVDHSTISPSATVEIAEKLAEEGVRFLDAPVSGGSEGAANGTLSIMIGGDAGDVDRAMPFLKAMGKTITHVGKTGHGQMVKAVNQILVVGHALAMSEALVFAQAGGLDLEKTLEAVAGGAAGSWMLSNRGPQILKRDWRPGFTIDLQQKDVRLALQAADDLGVPALMTGIVHDLYRVLQKEGCGSEGNHALIKALEKLSGVQVGE
ncbi:NAD(P)-dependent oxidoreductase [bacterium]|nr:NAD(P)-dependent oxidoreductase [bacterium]